MTKHALLAAAIAGTLLGCSSDDGDFPGTTGGSPNVGGTTSAGGRGGSAGANAGSPGGAGLASGGRPGAAGTGGSAGRASGGASGAGATVGGGGQSGGGGMPTAGSGGTAGMNGGRPGSGGIDGAGAGGTAASGGTAGSGASSGASGSAGGGQAGSGAAGASGGLPFGNPAVPSAGCGKTTTVTNGKKTITSTGQQRTYIIDIPSSYDANKPYRLFYTSHWIGSTSEAVRDQNYYFLKPLADAAGEPAIFVAPQSDGSTWQEKDHALFDDILAYVKTNLCIDTTRVFATGFSFGGMITYSLSVNHQKDIRAAVGIAPANYNIYVPPKNHEPIAWMQTTGMGDTTCPWVNGNSTTQGAKFIAIEHATDNGCTVPSSIPTWQQGNHVCYDFMGCGASYPTKVCTFNGGHTNIANDPNSSANWIPQESFNFFKQF